MAEQTAVEEALRVSEAHYRGLFEATSDGLMVVTDAGLILDVNPSAERMMLAGPGDMLGRPLERYVDTTVDPPMARRTDGTSRPIACTEVPFGKGQQLVTLTELGELLELRSRLAHAERLEAIARLAGGVAHDFNNLLTALRANADVLRVQVRDLDDPTEALECVDGIVDGAERGVHLTGQLLAFGRRQVLRPEVLDPARFLERKADLFRSILRGNLVLEVDAPASPSGLGIRVDATQLETSLMNLVINATDAMPRGGLVRIELQLRDATVVIAVEDSGPGISDEVLPHIFEPFYTTKRGVGSGLGLASVHGFVVQSGGAVEAVAAPGGGARFEMALPLVEPPPVEPAPPNPQPSDDTERKGGEERILLIDDDDQVRRTVQRMLRSAGYDVHAVPSGAEGLEFLASDTVDLLITDVMMPGMSGIEVADAVSDDLPVIFISGYTDEVVGEQRGRFVAKPFMPRELLKIVRATLDERD
ncbi:MAG: ATP-binding protein [Myxococcota bacterium]